VRFSADSARSHQFKAAGFVTMKAVEWSQGVSVAVKQIVVEIAQCPDEQHHAEPRFRFARDSYGWHFCFSARERCSPVRASGSAVR
jgi:hypothetical protein